MKMDSIERLLKFLFTLFALPFLQEKTMHVYAGK